MEPSNSISVLENVLLHGSARDDDPAVPTLILVHGSMDRRGAWARIVRRLGPTWRVITYDRRGYARSVDSPGPFDVDHNVADLVAIIERHSKFPVVIAGHSFGGVVALTTVARRPDLVRSVAVYEPPQSWNAWWPGNTGGAMAVARADQPADAAEAFMRRVVGDATWERLPERTRAARRAEGRALVGELSDIRRVAPFDPTRIGRPVLVGRGERASNHQVRGADELSRAVGTAPVVLAGAGHNAHTSHAAEFAELLIEPLRTERDRTGDPSGWKSS